MPDHYLITLSFITTAISQRLLATWESIANRLLNGLMVAGWLLITAFIAHSVMYLNSFLGAGLPFSLFQELLPDVFLQKVNLFDYRRDDSIFLMVRICPLQASSESSSRMLRCTLSPKVILLCISGMTHSTRRFAGIGSVGAFTTSY
ncbi:hypothetical protein ACLFWW_001024 [Cronobacter sakazakii]